MIASTPAASAKNRRALVGVDVGDVVDDERSSDVGKASRVQGGRWFEGVQHGREQPQPVSAVAILLVPDLTGALHHDPTVVDAEDRSTGGRVEDAATSAHDGRMLLMASGSRRQSPSRSPSAAGRAHSCAGHTGAR
jgi:hypothetical protein